MNIEMTQSQLQNLSIISLRERFSETLGYPSSSRSRSFLIRKILWGLQAKEHGDISEMARTRALSIADDRDLKARLQDKQTPLRLAEKVVAIDTTTIDPRIPIPGSVIERFYKGTPVRVLVLENGFEWNGTFFKSLSAIAREVSGTRWNGFGFFRLTQ
jgi:hypothetical protein